MFGKFKIQFETSSNNYHLFLFLLLYLDLLELYSIVQAAWLYLQQNELSIQFWKYFDFGLKPTNSTWLFFLMSSSLKKLMTSTVSFSVWETCVWSLSFSLSNVLVLSLQIKFVCSYYYITMYFIQRENT